jgi:hypothetical protein
MFLSHAPARSPKLVAGERTRRDAEMRNAMRALGCMLCLIVGCGGGACTSDEDCAGNLVCDDGACEDTCEGTMGALDNLCTSGFLCTPGTFECESAAGTECTPEAGSTTCNGFLCDPTALACAQPVRCSDDSECGGYSCLLDRGGDRGHCAVHCETGIDVCAEGFMCNATTGACE